MRLLPNQRQNAKAKAKGKTHEEEPSSKKRKKLAKKEAAALDATLEPLATIAGTTTITASPTHIFRACIAALPGSPGAFTPEQKKLAEEATHAGPDAFAVFVNFTIPRDAYYGHRPNWGE